ncbi:hypothetical protein GCK32_011707 [Trichostrongylus colubriformis]|uniref:Peptidase aspartic putative domain-containing protein n=1 Tax=Trichostrongylus colubriformis TaxID=6319 RepID=A0AAN8EYC9_TRICO
METSWPSKKTTHLLSGTIQIQGPEGTRVVRILLDTGSELRGQSFTDSKLAEDLKLPVIARKTLRINTFGSNETKQGNYQQIQVEAKGQNDRSHKLKLFESKIITKASTQVNLQREDWKFMKKQGIQIPHSSEQSFPQILLGCDQLWEIMRGSMMKLPSGLHLLATKFGHMVSGKLSSKEKIEPMTIALTTEDEMDKWDHYWTLESSGTQEYTITGNKPTNEKAN